LERWWNYYQHPQPERLIPGLLYYSNSELYDDQSTRIIIAQFYAASLANDPERQRLLFDEVSKQGKKEAKYVVLAIYWLIGTDSSNSLIQRAAQDWKGDDLAEMTSKMLADPSINVLDRSPSSPADLDMLWAVFSATGRREPVEKIARAVALLNSEKWDGVMVGGAAQWSLVSNIKQHVRVRQIIESLATTGPPEQRKQMQELLAKAAAK
jgi:hypothetical protein